MAELEEVVLPEDMTDEEKSEVLSYMKNGLLGLTKITSSDIVQWFELYMAGKTYSEIAKIKGSSKSLIMYISHKSKWHDSKMEHYGDLVNNLTKRLTHVKLSSANTMANIVTALGKYYDKKFNKYLSQNDQAIVDDIDTKLLTQYFKSMDTLDKIVSSQEPSGDKSGKPLVNINMMGGATIEQSNEEVIEITDENAGDFLKNLAKAKKQKNDEKL